MTVLTPERFVTAPRPGAGIANPGGTRALVGCRTYSIKKDAFDECLYLVDLPASVEGVKPASAHLHTLSTKTSAGFWLSDNVAAYVDSTDHLLYAKDVSVDSCEWTSIGAIGVPIKSIRIARGQDGTATHLVFCAEVYADGDITAVREHDSSEAMAEWKRVKVYDSNFVRHWDKWLYPGKRSQLFAVDLESGEKASDWSFRGGIRNLLQGTTLEMPGVISTEGDFAVSSTHVAFTAKDPDLDPSWHTKQDIYLVPLQGRSTPVMVTKGDSHGFTSSPVFSSDGKQIAWLQQDMDGYESDRYKMHIANMNHDDDCTISGERILLEDWTLSPSSICFAGDNRSIVGIVEENEHKVIFEVDPDGSGKISDVQKLALDGSVEDIHVSEKSILATVSSFRGPNDIYLIDLARLHGIAQAAPLRLTDFGQSKASSLADLDLGRKAGQIRFPGHNGRTSYGWVHFPPGYSNNDDREAKTYPLVVLVHGGPAAAWNNSWSTRWNPIVFAAQGFFVATIDPAGSTGFGYAYQIENRLNWGGSPFDDIVEGVKHTLSSFKCIDPERVVAAGNSYGGYMMNWIQGHNEEKVFKGLVCHNGIFSLHNMWYSGDELWNAECELQGVPWQARQAYDKWSPEQYVDKWETPQLTIICGQDFRLPITEGLATFNTLQRKGVPSRLVYFDQENHWVSEPKNSIKWHKEVFSWLLKYSSAAEKNSPTCKGQSKD